MEVVIAGPDRVHRRQCDVLVSPAVACNEVLEQIDVGVGVKQQGVTATHEVAGHCLDRIERREIGFEMASRVHEICRVGTERHMPARQRFIMEDRIGGPVMLEQFAQGRQQIEVRIPRIRDTLQ